MMSAIVTVCSSRRHAASARAIALAIAHECRNVLGGTDTGIRWRISVQRNAGAEP